MNVNNRDLQFIRDSINNYNGPEIIQVQLQNRTILMPALILSRPNSIIEILKWSRILRTLPNDSAICVLSSYDNYKIFWYKVNDNTAFHIETNYNVSVVNHIIPAEYDANVNMNNNINNNQLLNYDDINI